MSTYVLMKILESAPDRYDRGIRWLTLGRLDRAYDRLTSYIQKGHRVLDLGCGTGALTLRAAERGARVKGIDVNAHMLEKAEQRARRAGFAENIEFSEMGVAELGNEPSESYDVVMSGLCFSELTGDELTYALDEVKRILRPGGLLLVADEVKPESAVKKILTRLIRCPLAVITYLLTQTTTRAIDQLPERLRKKDFSILSIRRSLLEDFIEIVAQKP